MRELLTTIDEVPADGRRARRHRSRDLAVDALLDLLGEGVARPTAQQVAERSGVSLRSIFRIFDDVQTLHAAASARQLTRVRHLFVEMDATGTLEERAGRTVDITSRLYEAVTPVRRAALRSAPDSPVLVAQLRRARTWLRTEVERVFAGEIERLGEPDLVAAVEVLLSFEAWDQLRFAQERTVEEATSSVRRAVLALLG